MAPLTKTTVQVQSVTSIPPQTLSTLSSVIIPEKPSGTWEVDALLSAFSQDHPVQRILSTFDKNSFKALALKENGADSVTQWTGPDGSVSATIAPFANKVSRCLGPLRLDTLGGVISKVIPQSGSINTLLVLVLQKEDTLQAAATAVARCFPEFSRKTVVGETKKQIPSRTVYVDFVVPSSKSAIQYKEIQNLVDSIRFCANLVDYPPTELNPTFYTAKAKEVAEKLNALPDKLGPVSFTVIKGAELTEKGFGGLVGVGKAAVEGPALVHLSYTPPACDGQKVVAWVGKGITYDTGGLSLKVGGIMVGMKCDMGGSAAVLSAFQLAVLNKSKHVVHAILCLAENAIDSKSTKNDDILHMYSGKTVEINNTDAEGRLVLADGVAYASRHLKPDLVATIATLTGAQYFVSGTQHAAVLASTDDLEEKIVRTGKQCGEWVFPMIYAPEILNSQFESQVADMKNSVKERMCPQSSAAGHFIESHLDENYKNPYLHIDIAGPAFVKDRGTGFGTGLLFNFLKEL